ncbi:hypothetical protein Scep_000249 [Stephania cephalantha]|uniref:Fatty acid desaturase domain-containing protein n=1 Tax=Stephania cephalantha TaxID=152367 RepID=A0AAP0L5S5_9MAGN
MVTVKENLESSPYYKIPFSHVVAKKRAKNVYWGCKWNVKDICQATTVLVVHGLCLFAPFYFNWKAVWLGVVLSWITGIGITVSFHRNLAHSSFKLPKGDPIDWVSIHKYHHKYVDTERDPHSPVEGFWFSHVNWLFDMDYMNQKTGVRIVLTLHGTFLVNSACHIWGRRDWNTRDLSKNNWLVAILTFGEGWHNNHHAFEFSATFSQRWWQVDFGWCLIKLMETIGLATEVKVPSEVHKQKMMIPST